MPKIRPGYLVVHCDGGARGNPGPSAAGCVIEDPAGNTRYLCGKYLGEATNNQAEYQAIKLAFEVIRDKFEKGKDAQFYLDSLLAVQQLNGLYKVKNARLQEIILEIRPLETILGSVYYNHVRREKNVVADAMVNKALDEKSFFLIREDIDRK